MKKQFLFLLIIFFAMQAGAQFKSASLQASGLTCAMCSNAINKSLQALPFVDVVKSDIKNSLFNIHFKSGQEVDIDALQKAVESAGFSVAKLKLTGDFEPVNVMNDEHIKIGNNTFHFVNVKDQTLKGEETITIVDKAFLTNKEFKKYSSATKMSCIQTGKAASCCQKDGITADTRIFHVTI